MADDVEMIPVDAAEPPKANPLAASAAPKVATLKLNPVARKPVLGGGVASALKPGLKLPPKPGVAAGLKLPPKPGMATGLKLPSKPGMAAGLKMPTVALKPGLKLPSKPVIRKPGATVAAAPLPKPVTPLAAAKPAAAPVSAPAAVVSAPAAVPVAKPVAVDAQGVGKLPTVEAKAVDRNETAPVVSANPNPLEALKTVTQKLKGITQEIPQQAILHKTGIIAEGAMSEAQKEASKHKTARISLSDAMGVAPVKDENAPMKTIRIKRPIDIPSAPKAEEPVPVPNPEAMPTIKTAAPAALSRPATTAAASTVTQRKTLKISRPGGAVRPAGKFGVKRPSQATTVAKTPASGDAPAAPAAAGEAPVADIADIPELPSAPVPVAAAPASDVPSWVMTLSTLLQIAACVAIGALAWFLYENAQLPPYCGGLGWQ